MAEDENRPERPRAEPEIIPPERGRIQSDWPPHTFDATGATHRVYVARLGPLGFALLMLAFAAVVALILIVMLGAVLIWIPVVAVLAVVAIVYRLLRSS
jgi:hypothetical protein